MQAVRTALAKTLAVRAPFLFARSGGSVHHQMQQHRRSNHAAASTHRTHTMTTPPSNKPAPPNAFLYLALTGVTEELDGLPLLQQCVLVAKHVARFAWELLAMLASIPYGLKTALLARSLPLHKRKHSTPTAPSPSRSSQPQTEANEDTVQPSQPQTEANEDTVPQSQPSHTIDGGQYGVYIDRDVQYGPRRRQTLDAYVPARLVQQHQLWQQQQQQQQSNESSADHRQQQGEQQHSPPALAPVVLFTHGGIWASGETWHYTWLATRLAQMGFVVLIHTYTLFPEASVPQMVEETSEALTWAMDNVQSLYHGDPECINFIGHSAGAHLVALALLHRAHHAEVTRSQGTAQQTSNTQSTAKPLTQGTRPPHPKLQVTDGRMPSRFVGICGVYNIDQHFLYEKGRGVHLLSMMARAFLGKAHFAALSPLVLLEACLRGRTASAALQQSSSEAALQQSSSEAALQQSSSEALQQSSSEAVPTAATAAAAVTAAVTDTQTEHVLQHAGLHTPHLIRHFPPSFFLGSQKDFMVPAVYSDQIAACLRRCGVPTRSYHYTDIAHSQFVTAWPLLEKQSSDKGVSSSNLEAGLPRYAADLVQILMGRSD